MPSHQHTAATVLVVENDAMINMAAVDAIVDQGYLALWAASADEALIVLAAHPEIEVLFTDIKMPGSIDGLVLASATHRDHPLIDIVIASGSLRPTADEMPAGAAFLPKPYSAKQVADALHKVINQTSRLARGCEYRT